MGAKEDGLSYTTKGYSIRSVLQASEISDEKWRSTSQICRPA